MRTLILRVRGPVAAGLLLVLAGCSSSSGYVNPDVDFGYIQRAAVIPFRNLTRDDLADERLHSVFLMEILEAKVLEIVDSGETVAAMRSLGVPLGAELTPEQAVRLGEKLGIDAYFFGVVEEYGMSAVDRGRGGEVTAVFGMKETETGSVIWRAQVHEDGSSAWKKLFGGGAAGMYEVSRKAVRKALETLL